MRKDKTVTVGLVGAGFAARLHGEAYKKVCGADVRLKTAADKDLAKAEELKELYGYENAAEGIEAILADPEIDVVDITAPPFLHKQMILDSLKAGKHVICEKPLTGYFGDPVPKAEMYSRVEADLKEIREAAEKAGKLVMYAENYVYATPVRRAAELIAAKKSKILFMKGEESTPGSMSAGAGIWKTIGGGPLQRIGCHPLGGMLYLKKISAEARGEEVRPVSVTADTGNVLQSTADKDRKFLAARPVDVEDFGTLTLTFSDGSKCTMFASDLLLGGTKNYIDIYGSDCAMNVNLTPTDMLNTYFCDEEGIENESISEMLPRKTGWNKAFVSDEVIRGYMDEMEDFMVCAAEGRKPQADLDLAIEVTRILHAAYISAEEGRRIEL